MPSGMVVVVLVHSFEKAQPIQAHPYVFEMFYISLIFVGLLKKQMCMVVEYTWCRVTTKSKITNLKINLRI